MDLAGIGAIASAAVAAIGIPATVVIGRWQTKAAVRAAQATAEAGLAQAQATFNAAQAAADAQHQQWRRGLRRDAWVAFIATIDQLSEEARRFAHNPNQPTRTALDGYGAAINRVWTAYALVELEGPGYIVEVADLVRSGCTNLSHAVNRTLNQRTPGQELEGQPMSEDMAAAVTLLQEARGAFVLLAREHLNGTSDAELEAAALAALNGPLQEPAG